MNDDFLAFFRAFGTVAFGRDLTGAVGAGDGRQDILFYTGVLAVGGEQVAAVEGRGAEPDDDLAGAGFGIFYFFVAEPVGPFEFVQSLWLA